MRMGDEPEVHMTAQSGYVLPEVVLLGGKSSVDDDDLATLRLKDVRIADRVGD